MGFSLQCTFPLKGKKQFLLSDKTDELGRGAPRLTKNYDNGGDGLFSPLSRGWTPLLSVRGGWEPHLPAPPVGVKPSGRQDLYKSSSFDVCEIWSGAVGIAPALGDIADEKMMSMHCISYVANLVTK